MLELFKRIISTLNHLDLPYMLSRSIALNLYATPRMTRDIDIVVHLQEKEVANFVNAFQQDFYCHEPSIREEVRRKGMFNLIDNQTGYKVDFVVRKNSPYRLKEFERRERNEILGFEAYVVSIEGLILSKLLWIQDLQSDKQKEDIRSLLENPYVDHEYVAYWIDKLSINTFNLLSHE